MHAPLRVLVGSLGPGMLPDAGAPPPEGTVLLDLGADHPSRAGLLELRLWTEDAHIRSAEVVVGAMHRGAEKLFEVRDYRQILMLADRHDWQAPFTGELSIALAGERMLGLEAPPRAVWLRTLLAEHTRIASLLGFLGYVWHRLGLPSAVAAVRERLRLQNAALTGNRVHPMANRLGGLSVDADDSWLDAELECMALVRALSFELEELMGSAEFRTATVGIAPLDRSMVGHYGVSGPAARASGVPLDLRLLSPYLAYAELAGVLRLKRAGVLRTGEIAMTGDAWARFVAMAADVGTAVLLVEAAAGRLRQLPGPVAVKLPKIVKLPEGHAYLATEAPLGMAGAYLVSRGEKTPWRLKLRTASFNNVSSLEAVLCGVAVEHLETALASMGYIVGDIDK